MLALAGLAWLLTVRWSRGMDMGLGTMGLDLLFFLALWVTMMAAMMFPSVAPVAITWARAIGRQSSGWRRTVRTTQFVSGYLVIWTSFGLLFFAALAAVERLLGASMGVGRWIGAGAFVLAGLQQLGPLKNVCLRHCRDPMMQLMDYARYTGRARDLKVGAHHAFYCVGCCWGLMILLVPLGMMNIAAMAGLAAIIFLEKLWRNGPMLARITGVAFIVLGLLAPFQPWLLPGLATTPM